jgi:8-oxo-dGTP diphosphatase
MPHRLHPDGWSISVKAVIVRGGEALLLQNGRGEWDLPGGRPEAGETREAALAREIFEECGLRAEVLHPLDEHLFEVIPGGFVWIAVYRCRPAPDAGLPTLGVEHQGAGWLSLDAIVEATSDAASAPDRHRRDWPRVAGRPFPPGYQRAVRLARGW